MCPVCFANAAVIGGSVVSTGGLTALVVGLFRSKKGSEQNDPTNNSKNVTERRNANGNDEHADNE
jgi:hypothetical protein